MTNPLESLPRDALGQVCALGAAFTWAIALVLFKRSGERIHPVSMNLFKNALATGLLALTLLTIGESLDSLKQFPIEDIYILIISGFIGIALADTVFFYSLNLVGVSMFVIVDCSYTPIVLFVSALFISEQLMAIHYIGGGLILTGLFICSRHPPPPNRSARQIVGGLLLGILSILLMAVGIVMAKPVLDVEGFPLIWAVTIRLMAGTAALALLATASQHRRRVWSVFRPASIWKYSVPASFFGSYVSMILWIGGFKYTSATVAAVLNQTSAFFAIILAVIVLKEKLSGRKIAAVLLAAGGVILITFPRVGQYIGDTYSQCAAFLFHD